MIAEWMLYCALCALGVFAVASVVERWLLSAGSQVRHVWTTALLLSLAIPAATYRFAPRKTITIPSTSAATVSADELSALAVSGEDIGEAPVAVATRDQSLRKFLPTNRVALGVWVALSAALSAYLMAGLIVLAGMRRRWRRGDVCGVKVLVSDRVGPAVVNVLSPEIVMPEWALTMDRYQLGLMIRHEQEHRRAGDPQLLALAQVALIAMPWNPALWWGVIRLGLAVELDCDARVLRTADPRTYGDLLLEVARPRRTPRLIASAAFAERARGLERRIRAIARRRNRVSRGARAGAAIVGLAVVGIAWVAPHPSVPSRWTVAGPMSGGAAPESLAASRSLDNAKQAELSGATPETLRTQPTERPSRGNAAVLPKATAIANDVTVGPPRPAFSSLDSLIYNRLFTGVALSQDEEMAARLLLSRLIELQAKQDQAVVIAGTQSAVARIQLNHERDSLLLALLPDDSDRALLGSRLTNAPIGGGRRGRSGNPPGLEVPAGMQMGGPRSGGRGRVGGGTPPQEVPASAVFDDVLFNVLFNGISLSPEQQSTARSLLTTYRQKVAATLPEPMPFQLRLQGSAGVIMQPESREALLAILSNDSDRAVVDSRIVVDVRVVNRQPPQQP